ncbi:hypothetical protein EJ05DRAFT_482173 [Pseudovirgaria hyperparasitica]|uniref:Peptidase M48 domain-containing protein n=1 Tax=Pseudovirgaria hyperparasitica TaxID=470096 RepID=A0A6A6WMI3_9PEZI|nr:uncharacterized protein EJ05DRAFT_482173 [Pseudovirgaria hyperparasitica]KAF2763363.1 hypothetical protein EJ05DRAFT_482173 [Pseudovirgaria hyperparasitica]
MWARMSRMGFSFSQATIYTRTRAFHSQRRRLLPSFRNNYRYQRFQQSKNIFQRWAARPTFYYEVGGIGLAGGGFYVYNLEDVPVSGRRRFNIIGPEREKSIAGGVGEMVLNQYRDRILPPHDRRVQAVQRVLQRLMPVSGIDNKESWKVYVIDSNDVNAFVTPDNNVFVFTGILPICKNEDGIAAVLGHEIAHNFAHHTAEKASRAAILYIPTLFVELAIPGTWSITNQILNLILSLPNGRAQESEADYIGLLMMARACYNPEEAVRLWSRMAEYEKRIGGGTPPEFMSTHPSSNNRGSKMSEWMYEAEAKRMESDCQATIGYSNAFRRSGAFGGYS